MQLAIVLFFFCGAALSFEYEALKTFAATSDAQDAPVTLPQSANVAFTCGESKSATVPTSVHQLRPGDINVVAALGDSLSAALEADALTLLEVTQEWRGLSWSAGGQDTFDTVHTMPNIIKKFNPNVKGFSTGKCTAQQFCPTGNFNVAVTGSVAANMSHQADLLIAAMKASTEIDFNNDWKIITIFVG